MTDDRVLTVGVLAIQGAVEEHVKALESVSVEGWKVATREVKLPGHLDGLDGLILPGGESTAMAIISERWGLLEPLKQWVNDNRPIWGTCAGMILLSNQAIKQCEGGQALIGGLDVQVCRNYFGSQIQSKEYDIKADFSRFKEIFGSGASDEAFTAVFIRAPAVIKAGPDVSVLATIYAAPHSSVREEVEKVLDEELVPRMKRKAADSSEPLQVIVAARKGI
jgi:pyridoxal 5'-phosphate synthase pdxT subunit